MLPKDVYITGYARSKMSDEELRSKVKPNLKGDEKVVEDFLKTFSYTAGAYDEAGGFQQLTKKLEEYEKKHSNVPVGRLFYLALPPSVYPQVASFNIFENEQKHSPDFASLLSCNTSSRLPFVPESGHCRRTLIHTAYAGLQRHQGKL